MNDVTRTSNTRLSQLRELFEDRRIGCRPVHRNWTTAHTEELFRIAEALQRERDMSATVAGRALTELHEKVTADQSARSLVDRHPNSNGTNAGSNPAGRSTHEPPADWNSQALARANQDISRLERELRDANEELKWRREAEGTAQPPLERLQRPFTPDEAKAYRAFIEEHFEPASSQPPAPVRRCHHAFDVLVIVTAYESGFGHGQKLDELPNPHSEGSYEHHAYSIGYEQGEERRRANGSSGYCNQGAHEQCTNLRQQCMCKCHAPTKPGEQA